MVNITFALEFVTPFKLVCNCGITIFIFDFLLVCTFCTIFAPSKSV